MLDSSGRLTLVPPHPLRAIFRRPQPYILLLLGIAGLLTSVLGTDPTLRLVTGAYALAVAWILIVVMIRTARFRFDLTPGLLTLSGPKKPLLLPIEQLKHVLVVQNFKRGFGLTQTAYYVLNENGEAKFVWFARSWAPGQWEQLWQAIGSPPFSTDEQPATMAQLIKRYPSLISAAETTALIQKKRTLRVRAVLIIVVCAAIIFILRPH